MGLLLAMLLLSISFGAAMALAGNGAPGVTPYARTLLAQVNLYRRDNGLTELAFDPVLLQAARSHSFVMFRQKRVSHLDFKKRFARAGSRLCVENVGWNYSTPLKQFDAWYGSVGHDRNMLVEDLRRAGIAEIGGYVTFIACR